MTDYCDHTPRRYTMSNCRHPRKYVTSRTKCYSGPANRHDQNPAAHGGVCEVETCACGAERYTNINGRHTETSGWIPPPLYTAGKAIPGEPNSEEPQPGCGGYRGDDLDTAKKMSVYACNCDERVRIEGRVPAVRFRTGEVLWCVTREAAS